MVATVETVSPLERRITIKVPMQALEVEIGTRINRLARTAKLQGFRPGKVPMKMVEQMYGSQVRDEVLSGAVEKSFGDAVQENKLRVAGFPNIEHKPFVEATGEFEYVATFEVFPEVKIGDLSKLKIERSTLEVGENDIEKTINVMREQRATYEPVKRAAKKGDRVNIVLNASIDGQLVESTGDEGLDIILGAAGRVPEFDENVMGAKTGTAKTFEITYPSDHNPAQLAGKTVSYDLTVNSVSQAVLPVVDAAFAKALGVVSGDIETMKSEIKESLTQEVQKRVKAKLKEQVFNALVENVPLELPKALIGLEIDRIMQMTSQNLQQRGVDLANVQLEPNMFQDQAKRGVALRLILGELVVKNNLQASAEQIRAMVDQFAVSFEQPEQVVKWYYADVKRLDEPAALATEENVVTFVTAAAKVTDKKVKFDDFMGNA